MKLQLRPIELLALAAVGGCTVTPRPTIMVLPGEGKIFTDFQADDYNCRANAAQSIGYTSPAQAGNQATVSSAAGAANGQVSVSGAPLQQTYNVTYAQCMAARGNKVPQTAPVATSVPPTAYCPYSVYPAPYAFYPGHGYLYPPFFIYGVGWLGYYGVWHGRYYGVWHGRRLNEDLPLSLCGHLPAHT